MAGLRAEGIGRRQIDELALRYEEPSAHLARVLAALARAEALLVRRRERYPRVDAYVARLEESVAEAVGAGREWQGAYQAAIGYPEQWRHSSVGRETPRGTVVPGKAA